MARFGAFGEEVYRSGVRRFIGKERTTIVVSEHGEKELPGDIVRSDGTLDLYDDVQTRFEISYRRRTGRLSIRGGGWVGHVPVNDRYMLSIEPRVPVGNLERMMVRGADVGVDILDNYARGYGPASERPEALCDVVADKFLEAVDRIWREGLLKMYRREARCGAMPFGRIDPFGTELLLNRTGKPGAVFAAFVRTEDCGPNRLLRAAAERLLRWYEGAAGLGQRGRRVERLREACGRLKAAGSWVRGSERGMEGEDKMIERLPVRHVAYVEAIRLAGLIVRDWGIGVKGPRGDVVLPIVLLNMADVFEKYARQVLKQEAVGRGAVRVRDGNIGGPDGARTELFGEFHAGTTSPRATPDIVIDDDEGALAVVDVKYKPARKVPERGDINQVVTYAVRYNCRKAMILYPSILGGCGAVSSIGQIGGIRLYRGSLNLGADDIVSEEQRSSWAILEALGREVTPREG